MEKDTYFKLEILLIWTAIIACISALIFIYFINGREMNISQANQSYSDEINEIIKIEDIKHYKPNRKQNRPLLFFKRNKLKLTSILKINSTKIAIINGNHFKEKDKITDNVLLYKILKDKVIIIKENQKYILKVGERIEI